MKSPRLRAADWARVHAAFERIDTQQSTNELGPACSRGEIVEPRWAPEYLHALEAALDMADDSLLISLLDEQRPLHPILLPLLAERLRRRTQGLSQGGAPRKLYEADKQAIAQMAEVHGPKNIGVFDIDMANLLRVDPETIARVRRSLTKPPRAKSGPKRA